ncbi:unnamed protein product [Caenorhabditis brenneri]
MNNNNAYLLYLLNEGMAANIPKMIQMTTEVLDQPQNAQREAPKLKNFVKRPVNGYVLFFKTEGNSFAYLRLPNENPGVFLSRMWSEQSSDKRREYIDKANEIRKANEAAIFQNKQIIPIEKPNKTTNQSMAPNSSSGDDWFEKMAVTTASDPPFSSYNVQSTIEANWRPCSLLI